MRSEDVDNITEKDRERKKARLCSGVVSTPIGYLVFSLAKEAYLYQTVSNYAPYSWLGVGQQCPRLMNFEKFRLSPCHPDH